VPATIYISRPPAVNIAASRQPAVKTNVAKPPRKSRLAAIFSTLRMDLGISAMEIGLVRCRQRGGEASKMSLFRTYFMVNL